MKYAEYIEQLSRGSADFPIAYYHVTHVHPRYVMDLHWHPEFEIITVRSGRLDLYLNRRAYPLCKGDTAVVNPGVLHRGEPNGNCEYECTVFSPSMISPAGSAAAKYIKPLTEGTLVAQEYFSADDISVKNAAQDLFFALRECINKDVELSVYAALYRFFAVLYTEDHIEKAPLQTAQSKQLSHLTALISWIEENYTQRITLGELATRAGLSEKYLCRFFKEYTSYTPIVFINRMRVERAAADIRDKKMSLTDAAYANGFNDSSYFSKVFREVMGMSPSEYKKSIE